MKHLVKRRAQIPAQIQNYNISRAMLDTLWLIHNMLTPYALCKGRRVVIAVANVDHQIGGNTV